MHEIVLHFHDLKHARNLMRKLSQGKGVVVRAEHLGGGWFNGIKRLVDNPIVHKIGEKALDKGINLAEKYVEQKLTGGGLFGDIGNIIDQVSGKGIHKRGRPRKHHKKEDGDGLFGDIGNVIDTISGDGLKRRPRKHLKLPREHELYRKYGGSFMPL